MCNKERYIIFWYVQYLRQSVHKSFCNITKARKLVQGAKSKFGKSAMIIT